MSAYRGSTVVRTYQDSGWTFSAGWDHCRATEESRPEGRTADERLYQGAVSKYARSCTNHGLAIAPYIPSHPDARRKIPPFGMILGGERFTRAELLDSRSSGGIEIGVEIPVVVPANVRSPEVLPAQTQVQCQSICDSPGVLGVGSVPVTPS